MAPRWDWARRISGGRTAHQQQLSARETAVNWTERALIASEYCITELRTGGSMSLNLDPQALWYLLSNLGLA